MIYKEFADLKLSALGLGCMRLPIVDGKETEIDEAKTSEMVAMALENGINYIDTAWMYHGGNSETVMGKVLSKHPRDTFYLATKFPGFSTENMEKAPEIFEKQLEKCQTDYFDFYLYHNVTERNIDGYLKEEYGIHRYLMEQKKAGRIRHLGFSTHGSLATIKRFLDAHGTDMELCQIQLNWLDWKMQNAKAKVELIRSYGIPVWVMEPVRGGRLVNLEEGDMACLNALRPSVTTPEWAFRFLQSIEGVTMVLSGMSNAQQLRENLETFSTHKPVSAEEFDTLMEIADRMIAKNAVPCTGCSYCVKGCPMQIAIPDVIKLYNERERDDAAEPGIPGPAQCIGCGKCRTMCPQGIDIPRVMADYAEFLK